MATTLNSSIRSAGVELETAPEHFGEVRCSNDIADNAEALRTRMET